MKPMNAEEREIVLHGVMGLWAEVQQEYTSKARLRVIAAAALAELVGVYAEVSPPVRIESPPS